MSQVALQDEGTSLSGVYPKSAGAVSGGWGIVRVNDLEQLHAVTLTDGAVIGAVGGSALVPLDGRDADMRARFTVRADGVYVEASAQGAQVWIDGVRAERMAVSHGSVVRMGDMLGIFVERDLAQHCGRLGRLGDLVFGPRQRGWIEAALAYVRSQESFLIEGPPGCGKAALARSAIQSAATGRTPIVVDARSAAAKASVCDALAARVGALVVLHIERLDRLAQIETVRLMKRTPGTIIIGTLGRPLEQALSDGLLAPAMASVMSARRVRVPGLEERREDIAAIVAALAEREGIASGSVTTPVLEQFMRGGWAGGIREMREVLREVASGSMADRERIARVRDRCGRPASLSPLPLQQEDSDLARARLQRALDRAGGTIAAAARELHVSRQAFYREVKRLAVELPRKKLREAANA